MSAYKRLNTIDEGSYGVVHRAEDRVSGVQVALKKIKLDSAQTACGFPITSLREINILLSLRHRNIVELREIVTAPAGKGKQHAIYMVRTCATHAVFFFFSLRCRRPSERRRVVELTTLTLSL